MKRYNVEITYFCSFLLIGNFISNRYGDCHPVYFIGSLEAAFQEAFYGKARDVSVY